MSQETDPPTEPHRDGSSNDLAALEPWVSRNYQVEAPIRKHLKRLEEAFQVLARLEISQIQEIGISKAVALEDRTPLPSAGGPEDVSGRQRSHADASLFHSQKTDDVPFRKLRIGQDHTRAPGRIRDEPSGVNSLSNRMMMPVQPLEAHVLGPSARRVATR